MTKLERVKAMLPHRANIYRIMDRCEQAVGGFVSKGAAPPKELVRQYAECRKTFAEFEATYSALKAQAGLTTATCSECGAESGEKADRCPACNVKMAEGRRDPSETDVDVPLENNNAPAALAGAPAPAEENYFEDEDPRRRAAGTLDGRPIYNARKRRARIF